MDTLQKAFEGAIADMPRQVLAALLDRKLREKKIRLKKPELLKLAGDLIDNTSETFELNLPGAHAKKNVAIEITEEEQAKLVKDLNDFADNRIQKIVHDLTESSAQNILSTLRKRWPREAQRQRGEIAGFRRRLSQRWGRALDLLAMLLTMSREYGGDINDALRQQNDHMEPRLVEVLTRLHARACQITEEVICLLRGGFADGAMARWRTLHEIAAVSLLLSQHGEMLAERYVAHEVVESRKAALQYQRYASRLGTEGLTETELNDIEVQYKAATAKYGENFAHPQGWAAEALGKKNPQIAELHEAAGIEHLGPYYRLASHNVHANPKGIFKKLGLMEGTHVLLSGPSNAGLADPGHSAAISLLQISTSLHRLVTNIDTIVALNMMSQLIPQIGEEFAKAHAQLQNDEEEFQRTMSTWVREETSGVRS